LFILYQIQDVFSSGFGGTFHIVHTLRRESADFSLTSRR
jgi:hypothetical protein